MQRECRRTRLRLDHQFGWRGVEVGLCKLVGGVGQVEVRVDSFEGSVEVAFPEGDIVFVCREAC